jgi:1-acyl-sn-glycerol-3-phosphate acyltransferase
MIRFLFLNAFIGILSIILCFWALGIFIFTRNGSLLHRYAAVPWAKAILFVCGVTLEVKGRENLGEKRPRIYMSNHQSYFDILALLAGLPVDFKFVLKQELMKIPLLGFTLGKVGYISIDRSDMRKAVKSIHEAAEKIKDGASVLIFPEGTRSENGRLQAFKKGGFHLALSSGCDIVPIALNRSREIVPKGTLRINKGTIFMSIGESIPVEKYSKREIDRLMARSKESITHQMAQFTGQ